MTPFEQVDQERSLCVRQRRWLWCALLIAIGVAAGALGLGAGWGCP